MAQETRAADAGPPRPPSEPSRRSDSCPPPPPPPPAFGFAPFPPPTPSAAHAEPDRSSSVPPPLPPPAPVPRRRTKSFFWGCIPAQELEGTLWTKEGLAERAHQLNLPAWLQDLMLQDFAQQTICKWKVLLPWHLGWGPPLREPTGVWQNWPTFLWADFSLFFFLTQGKRTCSEQEAEGLKLVEWTPMGQTG